MDNGNRSALTRGRRQEFRETHPWSKEGDQSSLGLRSDNVVKVLGIQNGLEVRMTISECENTLGDGEGAHRVGGIFEASKGRASKCEQKQW